MRVRGLAAILCLLGASLVLGPQGSASPAIGTCSERSWTGGTTEWCNGALVYRDYVYDDTGASGGAGLLGIDLFPRLVGLAGLASPHGTSLSPASGTVDHRDHGQSLNSADLLTLRLWHESGELHARFELNTLFPRDRTIAALAIDTDDDPSTGGGSWKASAGVDILSRGWDVAYGFDAADPDANVITGSVPMPQPATGRWRIQAVVALGDGTPMNVAFRPSESGTWFEEGQSAALAAGDISRFGHSIEVADLLAGDTHRLATDPGPGLYHRVYTSDHPIAEGVDPDGRTIHGARGTYHYLGRHQPYAVHIPEPGEHSDYGVQLVLHGMSAAHGISDGLSSTFGDMLRRTGDKPRIVVSPLGRGPEGSYVSYSERDVLDVMDDVESHYPIDLDRVFVSGYSMGGGGTMYLSNAYPDRFAGGINWVGFTGDCLNGTPLAQGRQRPDPPIEGTWQNDPPGCVGEGNPFDYVESTRHVPMAMVYAAGDELVWVNHAAGLMKRYADLGYEHIMYLYPAAEHLTFAILDDWELEAAWAANRALVRNPARVSYRTNTYLWFEQAGIRHDSAYWVGGLEPREAQPGPRGDIVVELTSHRCAPHANYTADLTYSAGVAPLPWVSQEGKPRWDSPVEQADRLSGSLANVSSLVIDVEGACLGDGPIELSISVDGPTVVGFSDGRPSVTLGP